MNKTLIFRLIIGIIVVITLITCYFLLTRSESDKSEQSTDDAYIKADQTEIAPQISGQVKQVNVEEYQFVQTGSTLFILDDRDIQIQLKNAIANKHSHEADLQKLNALLKQQQSLIQQAQAYIQANQANLKLAQQDFQRFSNLAIDGSGTLQAKQQAEAKLKSIQAEYQKSVASLEENQQQIFVIQADISKAKSNIEAAEAGIDALKLKHSYTQVTAPISGFIHQRQIRVGRYAQTGVTQLTIIPLSAIYIEANFRETQLAKICKGQKVNIQIDALPNNIFNGTVLSLGVASGASLSQIAPHNATGNFTKIVQRLPIRIQFDANQKDLDKLRMGMSVVPTVVIDKSQCK